MYRVEADLEVLHSPNTGYFETQQILAKTTYIPSEPVAEDIVTEENLGVVDAMMMPNFANHPLTVPTSTDLLAAQAWLVRGENLILNSTKDHLKFGEVGPLESEVGHTALLNIVRTESEPRHLATLWKRRQKAHAGSTPSVKRVYTRNLCEFIHCKCSICVFFKNSAGG